MSFLRAPLTEGAADAAAASRTLATNQSVSASPASASPEPSAPLASAPLSATLTLGQRLKLVSDEVIDGSTVARRELRALVREVGTQLAESSQGGGAGGDTVRSSAQAATSRSSSGDLLVSDEESSHSAESAGRRVKVATLPGDPNLTNAEIEAMEDRAAKTLYGENYRSGADWKVRWPKVADYAAAVTQLFIAHDGEFHALWVQYARTRCRTLADGYVLPYTFELHAQLAMRMFLVTNGRANYLQKIIGQHLKYVHVPENVQALCTSLGVSVPRRAANKEARRSAARHEQKIAETLLAIGIERSGMVPFDNYQVRYWQTPICSALSSSRLTQTPHHHYYPFLLHPPPWSTIQDGDHRAQVAGQMKRGDDTYRIMITSLFVLSELELLHSMLREEGDETVAHTLVVQCEVRDLFADVRGAELFNDCYGVPPRGQTTTDEPSEHMTLVLRAIRREHAAAYASKHCNVPDKSKGSRAPRFVPSNLKRAANNNNTGGATDWLEPHTVGIGAMDVTTKSSLEAMAWLLQHCLLVDTAALARGMHAHGIGLDAFSSATPRIHLQVNPLCGDAETYLRLRRLLSWCFADGWSYLKLAGTTTSGAITANELVFSAEHGFRNNAAVSYSSNGKSPIVGLASDATYFCVCAGDATTMQLSASEGGAPLALSGGAAGNSIVRKDKRVQRDATVAMLKRTLASVFPVPELWHVAYSMVKFIFLGGTKDSKEHRLFRTILIEPFNKRLSGAGVQTITRSAQARTLSFDGMVRGTTTSALFPSSRALPPLLTHPARTEPPFSSCASLLFSTRSWPYFTQAIWICALISLNALS